MIEIPEFYVNPKNQRGRPAKIRASSINTAAEAFKAKFGKGGTLKVRSADRANAKVREVTV